APVVFESPESPANVFCKESSTGVSSRASKSRAAFSFFKTDFTAAGLAAGVGMELEASVMFMRIVSRGVSRWSLVVGRSRLVYDAKWFCQPRKANDERLTTNDQRPNDQRLTTSIR